MRGLGVRTIREGLRWHLIGEGPRDWSSAQAQIAAARTHGLQVAWDICHWGVPDGLQVMDPDWPARLAQFAVDAALMLQREGCDVAAFVPVNEISFWAWAGDQKTGFHPRMPGQGNALKRQLVAGHHAVVRALRGAGISTPIMVCEPLIWVLPRSPSAFHQAEAAAFIEASWGAIDWILADMPDGIDVLGLNFYPHNQWVLKGARVPLEDPAWRPFSALLQGAAARFGLPIVVAETGAEEPQGDAWLGYVADEVALAMRRGVRIEGVCVYPAADYPGWDNHRHCPCGPLGLRAGRRFVRRGQAEALRRLQALTARQQNGLLVAQR